MAHDVAATAVLLPQLLTTVGSAPHLAGAIRVGFGGLITASLLAAVLIESQRQDGIGSGRWRRPRFPKALIAGFVIVATAILALVGGGRIAALLLDIAIVAALLSASKQLVFFFWRDSTTRDDEPATETLPDMLLLIVLATFRFATLLIGIVALIVIMQVPLAELTAGSNPLAQFALHLADTVALAFVVYLGWIATRFAIDRRLRQLGPLDPHSPPTESMRLLTLLPLLRTTLAIVFITLFTLSALWTMGIEIAPLLAGAGIFGLAIGLRGRGPEGCGVVDLDPRLRFSRRTIDTRSCCRPAWTPADLGCPSRGAGDAVSRLGNHGRVCRSGFFCLRIWCLLPRNHRAAPGSHCRPFW